MLTQGMPRLRKRLQVQGVVQGVGFRPFVYGLAQQFGLTGFVGNDSHGVFIEIEGAPETLCRFEQALVAHPPPLAHIEQIAGIGHARVQRRRVYDCGEPHRTNRAHAGLARPRHLRRLPARAIRSQ